MNTKSLIKGSLVSRNYCQPFRLGSEFIQKAPKTGIYNLVWPIFPLRECPNTEFFLVRIFPYSNWIRTRRNTVFRHFPHSVSFYFTWIFRVVKERDLPTRFVSKAPFTDFEYSAPIIVGCCHCINCPVIPNFVGPAFSHTSSILSLYGKIRVRENLYSGTF